MLNTHICKQMNKMVPLITYIKIKIKIMFFWSVNFLLKNESYWRGKVEKWPNFGKCGWMVLWRKNNFYRWIGHVWLVYDHSFFHLLWSDFNFLVISKPPEHVWSFEYVAILFLCSWKKTNIPSFINNIFFKWHNVDFDSEDNVWWRNHCSKTSYWLEVSGKFYFE